MLTQEVVIMGRPRRAFTRKFKQEAVKLVTAGGDYWVLLAFTLPHGSESKNYGGS